jgi:tetratricopeptide (TPR) repeat protein
MTGRFILLLLLTVVPGAAHAQGGHTKVQEGNQLYTEEKYDEASTKYRDALVDNPESSIINFNIGDTQYKIGNFEEALQHYQKSTGADDLLLQSKSYYNIGNTLYRLGKLPESIQAYEKALKLNPDDDEAKYNLEYVRAKLKNDAEKQQQNQQEQQQNQENQDQQNQQNQDQQQQQDQQDPGQQGNEQEKQDQKNQEEQNQAQQDQNQKDQQQQPNQQQEQQPEEQREISKEDAQRLLEALENEEEDLLKQQKVRTSGGAFRGKDW